MASHWVRVQLHPLGILTLLELADGEGIIAAGVDQMRGYAITAREVEAPHGATADADPEAAVRAILGANGRPARTSEFSSTTDD